MLCGLYVLYDVFDFSRIRPIAQDKGINIEYLALAIWDEWYNYDIYVLFTIFRTRFPQKSVIENVP